MGRGSTIRLPMHLCFEQPEMWLAWQKHVVTVLWKGCISLTDVKRSQDPRLEAFYRWELSQRMQRHRKEDRGCA
jgi:hypothetical protein